MSAAERASRDFRLHFGRAPDGVAFVPGRVNLIGEHVDYNGGLVLPMPIAAGTAIAWARRDDDMVRTLALDFGNARDSFALAKPDRLEPFDWRGYVRGMAASCAAQAIPTAGADLAIAGSIPRGSGLSSSASLCVAVGRALSAAAGEEAPLPLALALAAQQAEHQYAGVHCGIMDQLAVAAGVRGSALLIDCRSLESSPVELPSDWTVMIVQSGVSRGLVDGHYNQRRADCQAAADALGIATLRDADAGMVQSAALAPVIQRRARHVVSEIARTSLAVEAIAAGDLARLGKLLAASHASMRDDFEITVPPVDRLVALLDAAIDGKGGARMTGGGFGGAVVAVLETRAVDSVRAAVLAQYSTPDGGAPEIVLEHSAA